MIIRRIHIASFGPLRDFDCELYSGMNLVRGENESGKTSLAMFIKFIFYGLSGRGSDGAVSERKKYVNWDTGTADGFVIVEADGREYRIERTLAVSAKAGGEREIARETVTVTDTATGERVPAFEECAGAALFGVPEQVFVNTVFSGGNVGAKIDGADTAAAVENMLFSADETVNVKKAAERLDKYRRVLLHKKGSGGEIALLRERCTSLRARLDEASARAAEMIELENSASSCREAQRELTERIERETEVLNRYDAEQLCRAGDDAEAADKNAAEAETELRRVLSLCCDVTRLDEGRRLAAALEADRAASKEFEERLGELESGIAGLDFPVAEEEPDSILEKFRRARAAATSLGVGGTVAGVLAAAAGAASAVLYAMKEQLFLLPLAAAALLALACGVLLMLRARRLRTAASLCAMLDAEDEASLTAEVEYHRARAEEAETLRRKAELVRLSLEQSREHMEALEIESRALAASFEDCCKAERGDGEPLERLRRAIRIAEERQSAADAARNACETAAAIAGAKWSSISREKLAAARELVATTRAGENYPDGESAADGIRRDLSFSTAKLDALGKKLHSAEVELAAKRAVAESPAELWEELSEANEQLRRLTLKHDAAVLAGETLAQAGENMRRGIVPRLIRRASAMFSEATEHRYEGLGSGNAFSLSAVIDGHTRAAELLSSGTEELAYVCLRIALAEELLGDKKPPLIFDECLAYMDPQRSAAAAELLAGSGYQVLLFTCRALDGTAPTLRLKRADGRGTDGADM